MGIKAEILKEVSEKFVSDTFFVPVIGAEIEFYLVGDQPDDVVQEMLHKCESAGVEPLEVKEEEGKGQYEIALKHLDDPVLLASRILKLRQVIDADFSAKPFKDDYGSSLHIHVSLLDQNGNNMLQKNGDDESKVMQYSIGGLLMSMFGNMDIFAPYKECYDRLLGGKDAPSTISWGGNNRTVAIRLPTTTTDPANRRIEHRVAAADANPYLVIAAILEGISFGIVNKILPESEKIYGDAGLEMYGLPSIVLEL